MYVWMFAVDEHGRVGQRRFKSGSRPFLPLGEDTGRTAGYLFKVDPLWGEVMPDKPLPVTETRLEAWLDAGILVDPNE